MSHLVCEGKLAHVCSRVGAMVGSTHVRVVGLYKMLLPFAGNWVAAMDNIQGSNDGGLRDDWCE